MKAILSAAVRVLISADTRGPDLGEQVQREEIPCWSPPWPCPADPWGFKWERFPRKESAKRNKPFLGVTRWKKCAVHRIRGCSPPSLWEHWGVEGTARPPRLGLSLTARAGPGCCLPWVPEKGVRSTGRSSGIPTAERNFRGRGLLPKEQKRAELTPNRPSCEKMLFYIGFKYNFIFLMEIIQKALWGQRFPGISHD